MPEMEEPAQPKPADPSDSEHPSDAAEPEAVSPDAEAPATAVAEEVAPKPADPSELGHTNGAEVQEAVSPDAEAPKPADPLDSEHPDGAEEPEAVSPDAKAPAPAVSEKKAAEEEAPTTRSPPSKDAETNAEGWRPFTMEELLGKAGEAAAAGRSAYEEGNGARSVGAEGSSQDNIRLLSHHDIAMDLINSVTGVDEEGRSRQRILSFAAKRYISAIERNPEDSDAYYNWALVLQESADNVDPDSNSS